MSQYRVRLWWQSAISNWLNRRLPPSSEMVLNQKNVFIFPNRFGWAYLLMMVLLFLLGTNYQNNLILALAYLLSSLFVTSAFHSFFNLSALMIQARHPVSIYLGESVRFELILKGDKERFDMRLSAEGGLSEHLTDFERDARLGVAFTPKNRGWFSVSRLRLSTQYPLGIFNCWTLLDMNQKALVYPSPVICSLNLARGKEGLEEEEESLAARGDQEFVGIRPYRVGETLNQVAWKQVAQGRGWVSKEFSQPDTRRSWLRLSDTTGESLEQRLGKLCHQIIELSRQNTAYGLDLGALVIQPETGKAHKSNCLKALALY